MTRGIAMRQRGAALIALAALIVMGTSWMLITALGKTANRTAAEREHNAKVLAEAKTALAAWVAVNAFESTEDNPGRLPCPQYWGDVGSSNEGRAGASCISSAAPTQPAAGWLPWRTLGVSKLLDASGTQLWYVVSPGWAGRTDAATLTINSNSQGQITLDGQANAAVALIIAPGRALGISPNANQSAAGCATRNQLQALNLPSTTPNALDFLECQNGSTTDGSFVTSVIDNATNPVFNDQMVVVTTADILPALEAAIAKRIERDIAPQLRTVYGSALWGTTAANPAFPFPAPFGDPATSNYQGATSTASTGGLLPFNYSTSCDPVTEPRCTTTLLSWKAPTVSKIGGSGSLGSVSCAQYDATWDYCTGSYSGSVQLRMDDAVRNVAMALRTYAPISPAGYFYYYSGGWVQVAPNFSQGFNSDGSFSFYVTGNAPNIGVSTPYWFYSYRATFNDHSLLDASNATTGWFVRNEWYRLLYYAIAPNHAPGGTLSCSDSGVITCVQVTNLTDPTKQRAVLALAGRSLPTLSQTRPPTTLPLWLDNYLDNAANRDGDSIFVQSPVGRSFNDRFISVNKNP